MKTPENRIKRLEISVITLSIMLVFSLSISIYGTLQIMALSSKIPSYKEIKEDIKLVKNAYEFSKSKAPIVKNAVVDSYEYTKEKANGVIDYFKKDKNDK